MHLAISDSGASLTAKSGKSNHTADRRCVAILVIEDDRSRRTRIVRFLRDQGFQVSGVDDGEKAGFALFEVHRPALVLDLITPVREIPALFRTMPASDLAPLPPLVVAFNIENGSQKGYDRGKEVDLDDLLLIANSLCVRRN